jgi:hypothetical protein
MTAKWGPIKQTAEKFHSFSEKYWNSRQLEEKGVCTFRGHFQGKKCELKNAGSAYFSRVFVKSCETYAPFVRFDPMSGALRLG